ncbi:dicarboxylate/amino acid:cation symporter [Lactobacillus sp. ESL0791]|uniref:dicarboxylate/amino acid:cation symporter n=1 Tax=Lactobacillus sp. ESL0791 TaxID=2983234 RepID=UPI0023F92E7B|nr:dicarboxylate/amino acid:cation symporter [Lactobacillus sp. ESL0791]MDF7637951.1 dicarboxylate/amino acid:cation symporter [Lactobacillus sp. ESL0791]
MHKLSLTVQITIGMFIGAIVGIFFKDWAHAGKIVGDVFLRLLQMAVVLLILGSVIEALGSLKIQELGRLGLKTGIWFSLTTIIAAIVGLICGLIFKPGKIIHPAKLLNNVHVGTGINWHQTILNFFPDNIFAALAKGDDIQVIVFAIFFGIVLSQANEQGQFKQILQLIKQLNQLVVKLVMLVIKAAPLGIACLFAGTIAANGKQIFLPLLYFLLLYAATTVAFLTLLFVFVSLYARVSFLSLLKGLSRIILVAFTTTSSAVTLPIEMVDAEEKLGVAKSVSQLVLPLGMALNSNGLALYLALVCVTLMQLYGLTATPIMLLKIILLAVLSCLGTVVVPGGGLVALSIVVPALGFPTSAIALFAGIDWFVGMFRAVANVVGDTVTAVGVAASTNGLNRQVYQNYKGTKNVS